MKDKFFFFYLLPTLTKLCMWIILKYWLRLVIIHKVHPTAGWISELCVCVATDLRDQLINCVRDVETDPFVKSLKRTQQLNLFTAQLVWPPNVCLHSLVQKWRVKQLFHTDHWLFVACLGNYGMDCHNVWYKYPWRRTWSGPKSFHSTEVKVAKSNFTFIFHLKIQTRHVTFAALLSCFWKSHFLVMYLNVI